MSSFFHNLTNSLQSVLHNWEAIIAFSGLDYLAPRITSMMYRTASPLGEIGAAAVNGTVDVFRFAVWDHFKL